MSEMMEHAENVPQTLFHTCIQLISENLDIVESFQGFPSLIGEKIFQVSLASKKIQQTDYATQAVTLFTEAFYEEFLSSLNLTGEHLGINYYQDQIFLFKDLVEVDVSDCGLGDDHELMNHVSKLHSLEKLHIRNNCLTDRGLQKLTLPFRMFGRGPINLRQMDLSGNTGLTKNCLKYLVPFLCLDEVFFCHCPQIEDSGHKNWKVSYAYMVSPPTIHTQGWAKDLVETWMKKARDRAGSKPHKKSWFYSRPKIELSVSESATSAKSYHSQCKKRCLVAYRKKDLPPTEQNPVSTQHRLDVGPTSKRRLERRFDVGPTSSQRHVLSGNRSTKPSKQCTADEDSDLMNMYTVKDHTVTEAEDHNTLLLSLTDCEINNKKCDQIRVDTHISSHRKIVSSKPKLQIKSKSQTVSKLDTRMKSQTNSKEVKQSSMLKFYCSENKETSEVATRPIVRKSFDKELRTNSEQVANKVIDKENLIKPTVIGDGKRFVLKLVSDTDNDRMASHNDGPVRKKRKIVIVRPQTDLKSTKPSDSVATYEQKLSLDKPQSTKEKNSFLSYLDQWI